MPAPTQIRLRRQLTPAQFRQLCEQLHQIYPSWRQPVTPQVRAWVQVAYNGRTILIHPRRDYVLEHDVAHTVQRLLNDLPEPSAAPWFMADLPVAPDSTARSHLRRSRFALMDQVADTGCLRQAAPPSPRSSATLVTGLSVHLRANIHGPLP